MSSNNQKKSAFSALVKGFKDGFKPSVTRAGGKQKSNSELMRQRKGFAGSKNN